VITRGLVDEAEAEALLNETYALYLMLMPTAKSWEVPACTSFYGAGRSRGHEALIRVMEGWWERFGAELIASWGTELQFRVERPPSDIQSAYELALEQAAVAGYTIVGVGVSVRQRP
jgi:hypothetical protein